MTTLLTLVTPIKSVIGWGVDITFNLLFKIRFILIILITVGIGAGLGFLLASSREVVELTLSILTIFLAFLLVVRHPLNGLLSLFILMPFIEQWVEIPMGAGLPDLSFSRFTIAFLAVFMLARAAIGQFKFVTPIGIIEFCIIATTLGVISVAPLSIKPNQTIVVGISRHLTPLIMYFFAKNLVRDKKDLDKVFWAIAIFGFLAAVYAVYEVSTGHILFVSKDTDVSSLRTEFAGDIYLIRGLLGLAANFGRTFLSSIPVTFYLLFENKRPESKVILAGMVVVQFVAMFLTHNRTSWLALMIALFVLQLFYPQFRKLYLVIVFVAAIVLAATWEQVNQSAIVEERLNTDSEEAESFNGRTPRWQAAFNMWKAKPIRGWGYGHFDLVSGRYRTDGSRKNLKSFENDFLRVLVGTGLVGFLPYLIFMVMPLIKSIGLFFRARAPDWTGFIKPESIAVYWVVLFGFAVGSYTQVVTQPITKIYPFAIAGAVIGTHEYWLRRPKPKQRTTLELDPKFIKVRET